MVDIAHSSLTDPQLHEPKGISAATVNQVYSADGAGGGVWQKVSNTNLAGITVNGPSGAQVRVDGAGGFKVGENDHGHITFVNTAAPFAMTTATTSFTKCAPTTTPSGRGVLFTEGTNARLTYTGLDSEHFELHANLSIDQATGATKDVSIAFAKNGVVLPESEQITTTVSANKQALTSYTTVSLTTNDYVEVFVKISSAATVNVYAFTLAAGLL